MRQQISWMLFLSLVVGVSRASAQTGEPQSQRWKPLLPAWRRPGLKTGTAFGLTLSRGSTSCLERKTKYQIASDCRSNFRSSGLEEIRVSRRAAAPGLGGRIVGRMLESEAEIAKDYGSTDISPNNYDLRFIREEECGRPTLLRA